MALFDYNPINQSQDQNPANRGYYGGGGQPKGTPSFVSKGYDEAADYIQQGSTIAEADLRQAFEDLFRHRASSLVAGQGEFKRRVGAEGASQGLSADLVRRGNFAGDARVRGEIGAARAESSSGLGFDLATLHKGTATELATLKGEETGSVMENFLQSRARKTARKAAKAKLLSSAFGLLGQTAQAAATFGAGGGAGAPPQSGGGSPFYGAS